MSYWEPDGRSQTCSYGGYCLSNFGSKKKFGLFGPSAILRKYFEKIVFKSRNLKREGVAVGIFVTNKNLHLRRKVVFIIGTIKIAKHLPGSFGFPRRLWKEWKIEPLYSDLICHLVGVLDYNPDWRILLVVTEKIVFHNRYLRKAKFWNFASSTFWRNVSEISKPNRAIVWKWRGEGFSMRNFLD